MSQHPEQHSPSEHEDRTCTAKMVASPVGEPNSLRPLVYVIGDDVSFGKTLRQYLENGGYRTRILETSSLALSEAENDSPEVFLLAASSHASHKALELCRQIRSTIPLAGTPIVMLSAGGGEAESVAGLDAGADDYIRKPFSPRELIARVRAVSRRFVAAKTSDIITIAHLVVDSSAVCATVHGEPAALTITEFRLLEFLARHPGRVFSRQRLLELVWQGTEQISPRAVDVYIRRIREKIEEDPEAPRFLKTIRGAGYRLDQPE